MSKVKDDKVYLTHNLESMNTLRRTWLVGRRIFLNQD